jgi:hypothetical protein
MTITLTDHNTHLKMELYKRDSDPRMTLTLNTATLINNLDES